MKITDLKHFTLYSESESCNIARWNYEKFFQDNLQIVDNIQNADSIMVRWWDGFMLHSIKDYLDMNKIFLGINCWTLWFLMNDLDKFDIKDEIKIFQANLLEVEIYNKKGNKKIAYALNDIVIGKNVLDYYTFEITWQSYCQKIEGTGLIISSPIWSTAYRLAQGWPIMPLKANMWGIMWIASHPFGYKLIAPQEIEIKINWKQTALAGIDWYAWYHENVVKLVIRPTDKFVEMWFLRSQDISTKRLFLAEKKMN